MSFVDDSPETLNNLLRLKGLRNLGTRKRDMPAYNAMDIEAPDLAMTAQEEVNVPIPAEDGGFTPESYDVRANEVVVEEEPSVFQKLGHAFGSLLRGSQAQGAEIAPPQETMMETVEATPEPAVAAPQPRVPGILESLGYLRGAARGAREENQELLQNARSAIEQRNVQRSQGIPPTPASELIANAGADKERVRQEAIDVAQQKPWMDIVYGATNELAQQPELVRQLSDYTGVNFDEQLQSQVADAEKVLSELDKPLADLLSTYTADEVALRKRIDDAQTTQNDKLLIGFALLMPLLIGGFFGAEAGLGALAGGGESIANIYQQRGKNLREDEDALRELQKAQANVALKRGEIDLERLKLPQELRKNLPKDETAHLKGKMESFINPQTGEIQGGKVIYPDFVIPVEDLQDKDDVKFYKKEAKNLANEKASLKEANDITRELAEAAVQIDDPSLILRAANAWLLDEGDPKKIGLIGQLKKQAGMANAPEITIDGRKVNAYNYLSQKLERLNDLYRRTTGMRALTNTVAQHFEGLIANPISNGVKIRDFIEQILSLREGRQKSLVEEANALGFYKEPLIDAFTKDNQEFYNRLNLKHLEDKYREREKSVRGKKE